MISLFNINDLLISSFYSKTRLGEDAMVQKIITIVLFSMSLFALNVNAKVVKILSLSGGGTRGIMEAEYLAQLEEVTGKSVRSQFDVIVGTSTGGLIALLISLKSDTDPFSTKYSAREIVEIYKNISSKIFKLSLLDKAKNPFGLLKTKYDPKKLEQQIKAYVGEDTQLKDLLGWVGVTTVDTLKHEVLLLNNLKNATRHLFAWEAAHATSAAPSYFPAMKLQLKGEDTRNKTYVDGGVLENTPVVSAIKFAQEIYDPNKDEFVLVSLGTGSKTAKMEEMPAYLSYQDNAGKNVSIPLLRPKTELETKSQIESFYNFFEKGGLLKGGLGTVDFIFRSQTVQGLQKAGNMIGFPNMVHVQFQLKEDYPLDSAKEKTLNEMQEVAFKASYQNEFNAIKGLLRRKQHASTDDWKM